MKALSGREFARLIERHGWTLLRVHGSHHIYGRVGSVVRSQSMATDRSRQDYFAILQSSLSFRISSWISAMTRVGNTLLCRDNAVKLLGDVKQVREEIVRAS